MNKILTFFATLLWLGTACFADELASQGSSRISEWPIRQDDRVEVQDLRLNWSLSVIDDTPMLRLDGSWVPGKVVVIDDSRRAVCSGTKIAAEGSERCTDSDEHLIPFSGRFEVMGIVATDSVYFALLEVPLPAYWSPHKAYTLEVAIPWERLFLKDLSGLPRASYFDEDTARMIVKEGFTLDRLFFTKVDFVVNEK